MIDFWQMDLPELEVTNCDFKIALLPVSLIINDLPKMREELASNREVLKRLAEIDKSLLMHDTALRDLYQKILPLLQTPPDPPNREIGFRVEDGRGPDYKAGNKRRKKNA